MTLSPGIRTLTSDHPNQLCPNGGKTHAQQPKHDHKCDQCRGIRCESPEEQAGQSGAKAGEGDDHAEGVLVGEIAKEEEAGHGSA